MIDPYEFDEEKFMRDHWPALDFEAEMTWDEARAFDETDPWAMHRGTTLGVLTMDGMGLLHLFGQGEGLVPLLSTVEMVDCYCAHLNLLLNVARCARLRLLCVGQTLLDADQSTKH